MAVTAIDATGSIIVERVEVQNQETDIGFNLRGPSKVSHCSIEVSDDGIILGGSNSVAHANTLEVGGRGIVVEASRVRVVVTDNLIEAIGIGIHLPLSGA